MQWPSDPLVPGHIAYVTQISRITTIESRAYVNEIHAENYKNP